VKALDFAETQTAARALGITLQSVAVQATNDFDGAFEKITRERPDALIALVDEFINVNARQVGGFAAKSRLPAMFGDRRHVDAGGLMSYGPSLPDMFRRAAELVDKILKGVSPGDLPIEQPAKFEMVINRKAARALDLELSSLLLDRADEVIE
jgi:putative tryptophan/tyrosine transport system substrate-binding protein